MTSVPAVSVVIPLLNKRQSIERTITSIQRQELREIEIWVVDGGSSDGSPEAVEALGDERVRVLRRPGAGICEARNIGVASARSEFVAFIDGDDEWHPRHLANLVRARARFPACGLYATNYYLIGADGVRVDPGFQGIDMREDVCVVSSYFAASRPSSVLTCSSIALDKRVYTSVGGFPESETIKHEFCFFVRLALDHQIGFCTEPTFVYRLDAENRFDRRVAALKHSLSDCDRLLLRIIDVAIARRDYRNRSVSLRELRDFRAKARYWRASDLMRIGERRKAMAAAIRAMTAREYFVPGLKVLAKSGWAK